LTGKDRALVFSSFFVFHRCTKTTTVSQSKQDLGVLIENNVCARSDRSTTHKRGVSQNEFAPLVKAQLLLLPPQI
jgi:hypothetical protein